MADIKRANGEQKPAVSQLGGSKHTTEGCSQNDPACRYGQPHRKQLQLWRLFCALQVSQSSRKHFKNCSVRSLRNTLQ